MSDIVEKKKIPTLMSVSFLEPTEKKMSLTSSRFSSK